MIVVEVLGRRGEVVRQVRVDQLPATIGRAWNSDIVLADPTVDPSHARIVQGEDGMLALEDLGSVNGLHEGAQRQKVARIILGGVKTVRMGRATLRFARTDQPVPPALPDLAPTGRLASLMASAPGIALVHVIGIGLVLFAGWIDAYDPKSGAGTAGHVVLAVAAASAWAGVWSLIGRIRTQQFAFLQHSTLTWLALVVSMIVDEVAVLLDFLWPSQGTIAGLAGVAFAIIAAALMTAQLGLVSSARRGSRLVIAIGLVLALSWLAVLGGKEARNDFDSGTVHIAATLAPLPAKLVPSKSVGDFLRSTDDLKRDVDARIP